MIIEWRAIRSEMSLPETVGMAAVRPADTGCAHAGIQAAKAAVPPARPTPRKKSRRSRLDKCILASSQSLVSRDYAPASLPPQNFLKPCARSIEQIGSASCRERVCQYV